MLDDSVIKQYMISAVFFVSFLSHRNMERRWASGHSMPRMRSQRRRSGEIQQRQAGASERNSGIYIRKVISKVRVYDTALP